MYKILFSDLDGTLLPLEQDTFIAAYIKQMVTYLARFGYDPKAMAATVWAGSEDMIRNDGSATNENVFWNTMSATLGQQVLDDQAKFERYYIEEYHRLQEICGCDPEANALVQRLKREGIRVILATNPVFPAIATDQRIAWAGLNKADFELVTTYENSIFCKHNIQYYTSILEQLGLKAEECMMVGNDILDDMPASELGMKVFLLTDHLVNRKELPLDAYPHGGFKELNDFIDANR
jgi:FMN phosphatase YigB (HAD superfamily)